MRKNPLQNRFFLSEHRQKNCIIVKDTLFFLVRRHGYLQTFF